jgi:hypothetical protein
MNPKVCTRVSTLGETRLPVTISKRAKSMRAPSKAGMGRRLKRARFTLITAMRRMTTRGPAAIPAEMNPGDPHGAAHRLTRGYLPASMARRVCTITEKAWTTC